mmetsp:Transcript_14843/g.37874  ORF Transcript_14843/g.37874 Transcript_14843/m.37874 type:complete len:384 (+) Transcript_14843:367-1518(+)
MGAGGAARTWAAPPRPSRASRIVDRTGAGGAATWRAAPRRCSARGAAGSTAASATSTAARPPRRWAAAPPAASKAAARNTAAALAARSPAAPPPPRKKAAAASTASSSSSNNNTPPAASPSPHLTSPPSTTTTTTTTTTLAKPQPKTPLATAASAAPAALSAAFSRLRAAPRAALVLDGGTGEELFLRGVPDDRKIWSANALVRDECHDALRAVHRDFVRAGARAITANSYGVTPGVGFGEEKVRELVGLAVRIARGVADEEGKAQGKNVVVLGSLGPLVESYRADRVMPRVEGARWYAAMAAAMAAAGADGFIAETMSSAEESEQALDGVEKGGEGRPCLVSWSLRSDGRMRSGEEVQEAVPRVLRHAKAQGVAGEYTLSFG